MDCNSIDTYQSQWSINCSFNSLWIRAGPLKTPGHWAGGLSKRKSGGGGWGQRCLTNLGEGVKFNLSLGVQLKIPEMTQFEGLITLKMLELGV